MVLCLVLFLPFIPSVFRFLQGEDWVIDTPSSARALGDTTLERALILGSGLTTYVMFGLLVWVVLALFALLDDIIASLWVIGTQYNSGTLKAHGSLVENLKHLKDYKNALLELEVRA